MAMRAAAASGINETVTFVTCLQVPDQFNRDYQVMMRILTWDAV